jgi:plasmid stability protein
MPQILVRRIDAKVKSRLEQRARREGRSLEEEVRQILRVAANERARERPSVGDRIAARFAPFALEGPIAELRGQAPRAARFEP